MNVTFDVHGLDDIERKLKALGGRAAERALSSGLRAGAAVIVREARKRAPKRTGKLRKNIYSFKIKKKNRTHAVEYGVGVRVKGKPKDPKNAFYWSFIEFGTSKVPARPFLRPALKAGHSSAVTAMRRKVLQRIEIEAARLR